MTDEKELPLGWKKSEEYKESKQAGFVKRMTEETLAGHRPPKPIPSTIQCASTAATLARDPNQDEAHWNRHLPETGVVVEQHERLIPPDQYSHAQSVRHRQHNSMGESKLSSVDQEKRLKGIHAFTYSEPAKLTAEELKQLTRLVPMESTPLEPTVKQEKPMGWFARLSAKITKDILNP